MTTAIGSERETIKKLKADLMKAAKTLTGDEVRYLVDLYYQIQDFRLRAQSEKRATSLAKCHVCSVQAVFKKNKKTGAITLAEHDRPKTEDEVEAVTCTGSGQPIPPENMIREPNELVTWAFEEFETVEELIKKAMDVWTDNDVVGAWSKSIIGIGPVIAAGFLAHIDPTRSPTVGNLWSFAGLNPEQVWAKGQKRPWNARLKVLAWKLGESFAKFRSHEEDVYGKIFEKRWELEKERNASGMFKDQAVASLEKKTYDKKTEAHKAYAKGELPKARIYLRAKRKAVKIFLSHWLVVATWVKLQKLPPQPYSLTHLCACTHSATLHKPKCTSAGCGCTTYTGGHVHVIPVPNTELVPGLSDALQRAGRTA